MLSGNLVKLQEGACVADIACKTINEDVFKAVAKLPNAFIDLLIADPPYNMYKKFNGSAFVPQSHEGYCDYLDKWLSGIYHALKPNASIYICGDWKTSSAIQCVAEKYFTVRNRITWQREKGRGAKCNWKNSSEDIWFCTVGDEYTFNIDDVKLRKKVIAPYTDEAGKPKDWVMSEEGAYRLTHPSNIWSDMTVPFWSMPENTEHPTQKPEKLIARLILASSNEGDFVFDPFLGSGTTSVVAKKLGRQYAGIEREKLYCCIAEKRVQMAEDNKKIQGYKDNYFLERNS